MPGHPVSGPKVIRMVDGGLEREVSVEEVVGQCVLDLSVYI